VTPKRWLESVALKKRLESHGGVEIHMTQKSTDDMEVWTPTVLMKWDEKEMNLGARRPFPIELRGPFEDLYPYWAAAWWNLFIWGVRERVFVLIGKQS
jgi:hypothetical protein